MFLPINFPEKFMMLQSLYYRKPDCMFHQNPVRVCRNRFKGSAKDLQLMRSINVTVSWTSPTSIVSSKDILILLLNFHTSEELWHVLSKSSNGLPLTERFVKISKLLYIYSCGQEYKSNQYRNIEKYPDCFQISTLA